MSVFYDLNKTPRNILNQAIVRAIVSENNGALFDPSDLSTLYRDAAGTIPVTAVEQPVGKMLDKSGNGYHATQPITASRPTLSARYNLLTKTEDFSDAVWAKTAVIVTVNELKLGRYFDKVVGSSFGSNVNYLCTTGPIANTSFVFSLCVYSDQQRQITIRIRGNGTTTEATNYTVDLSVGINNIKVSKSFTALADGAQVLLIIYTGLVDTNFGTVWLDAADLRLGTTTGPYQRVNTATDYDTDERYFKKYLRFDGVDDYLNLPYMGLYAAGSASVVVARDSYRSAGSQTTVSEGNNSTSMPFYNPTKRNANFASVTASIRDNSGATVKSQEVFPEVISALDVRSTIDTGSLITHYRNGVSGSPASYSRAGSTLTLTHTTIGALQYSAPVVDYANMKVYGLIITKSALTDSQRVACERYLGRKSGVIL